MSADNQGDNGPIKWDLKHLGKLYLSGYDYSMLDDVTKMAQDAITAFKSELYRPAIVFSAEATFRLNCEALLRYIFSFGRFEHKFGNSHLFVLDPEEYSGLFEAVDLVEDELTYCKTINLLKDLGLIDRTVFEDMHALRNLRNSVVHSRLPILNPYSPDLDVPVRDFAHDLLLNNFELPLKYDQHKFDIEINKKNLEYIVDQERLGIDLREIPSPTNLQYSSREPEFATISLGIMYSNIEYFENNLDDTITELIKTFQYPIPPDNHLLKLQFSDQNTLMKSEQLRKSVSEARIAAENNVPIYPLIFFRSKPYFSFLNRCIKLVFHPGILPHLNSFEEIILCIEGLAKRLLPAWEKQAGVKGSKGLDLYRKDSPKVYDVIWIDKDEHRIVWEKQYKKQPESGFKVLELPDHIRNNRAIPGIIFACAYAYRENNKIDLSSALKLDEWVFGPH